MGNELAANRLTLVPSISVVSTQQHQRSTVLGDVGVPVSVTTGVPGAPADEVAIGSWSASGSSLELLLGPGDRGPRSSDAPDCRRWEIVPVRHRLLVTSDSLVATIEGDTPWGTSGLGAVGRIVVWRWRFDDIDTIDVVRAKKLLKWWDAEVRVSCAEPSAEFSWSGLGTSPGIFKATDAGAKGARSDGSDALGFAAVLSEAVSIATDRAAQHLRSEDGPRVRGDQFIFC